MVLSYVSPVDRHALLLTSRYFARSMDPSKLNKGETIAFICRFEHLKPNHRVCSQCLCLLPFFHFSKSNSKKKKEPNLRRCLRCYVPKEPKKVQILKWLGGWITLCPGCKKLVRCQDTVKNVYLGQLTFEEAYTFMFAHVCHKDPWTQIITRRVADMMRLWGIKEESLNGLEKNVFVHDILCKLEKAEEVIGESLPMIMMEMRSKGQTADVVMGSVQEIYKNAVKRKWCRVTRCSCLLLLLVSLLLFPFVGTRGPPNF